MIRKTVIIFSVFLWIGIRSFAQTPADTAQKLTLQQCIQIALKNNDDVLHGEMTSNIARTNWQGSKGYMIPNA
jgi:outer membrane protein